MQMIKLHSEFQIDKQQNGSTGKYQDQMTSILARINRDSQAIDERLIHGPNSHTVMVELKR
jgi:hypothetical protein